MASKIEFHDYSIEVMNEIDSRTVAVLEECAGEIVAHTKRNSRVDTGKTKNSFRYTVDKATHTAYMGSNYENALWEELGTGEYALNGDGRKGGWYYFASNGHKVTLNKDGSMRKNSKYKSTGNFIFTLGKRPHRPFWKAYIALKGKVKSRIQDALKGL